MYCVTTTKKPSVISPIHFRFVYGSLRFVLEIELSIVSIDCVTLGLVAVVPFARDLGCKVSIPETE
jgi:hypothetical protein